MTDASGWLIFGVIVVAAVLGIVASVGMFRLALRQLPTFTLDSPPWSFGDAVLPFGLWVFLELLASQMVFAAVLGQYAAEVRGTFSGALLQSQLIAAGASLLDRTQPLLLTISSLIRLGIVGYVMLQVRTAGKNPSLVCGWTWSRFRPGIAAGVLTFLALIPGWLIASLAWGICLEAFTEPTPQAIVETFRQAISRGDVVLPLILGFAAVVVAPVFEELLFRGMLLRVMIDRGVSVPLSVVVGGALFALIHGSLAAALPLFLFGCALGVVFIVTKNLWASIFLHAIFNGIQITAMLLSA